MRVDKFKQGDWSLERRNRTWVLKHYETDELPGYVSDASLKELLALLGEALTEVEK